MAYIVGLLFLRGLHHRETHVCTLLVLSSLSLTGALKFGVICSRQECRQHKYVKLGQDSVVQSVGGLGSTAVHIHRVHQTKMD